MMSAIIPSNSAALKGLGINKEPSRCRTEMRNLLLPMLFLSTLLCACTPTVTKTHASTTGSNKAEEATKEDTRQEVHGLAPR
jgi:hypothetical protein